MCPIKILVIQTTKQSWLRLSSPTVSLIVEGFDVYYFSQIYFLEYFRRIICSIHSFAGEHGINNLNATDSLKEAVEICETSLKSVQRQRFWYLLSGCILVIPLIWSIGLNYIATSLSIDIGLNILRIFLTAILCYTLFMSSIWNNVEKNALKAGCLAIKIYIKQSSNDLH